MVGRQRRGRSTRPRPTPSMSNAIVHDQLLRADREGARRRVRRRVKGLMTTIARLHRRPEQLVDGPHKRPPPGPWLRRSTSCRHRPVPPGPPSLVLESHEGQARRRPRSACRCPPGSITDFTGQPQDREAATVERSTPPTKQAAAEGPPQGHPPLHRRADRVERHRGRPAARASSTPTSP